ncbi:MAG TPA: P-loop NTPase [Vicinamibacteria bacterium]|nr:P-loop NTPase [Vicinamibacteria bacterium]
MTQLALRGVSRPRRQIWSVGGGKGGIGKSLLTAALGWQLARMGKRVILVDSDLGGANLHTCLGLRAPERTLGDFIRRRFERIEDVLVETGVPLLRLISGASDFLGAANIKYTQKVRVLNRIRSLEVDVLLLDLGAGTSYNIVDFFLVSDVGLLTVVPEPTSIENAYRFIKSALYRRLRNAARNEEVRKTIEAALDAKNQQGIKTPDDLLAAVEKGHPEEAAMLRRELDAFRPSFVVNQVREEADAAIGHQLVAACSRHLGLHSTYVGPIHYDEAVWRSVRQRRLFMADAPRSRAAEDVAKLVRTLVQGETLTLPW